MCNLSEKEKVLVADDVAAVLAQPDAATPVAAAKARRASTNARVVVADPLVGAHGVLFRAAHARKGIERGAVDGKHDRGHERGLAQRQRRRDRRQRRQVAVVDQKRDLDDVLCRTRRGRACRLAIAVDNLDVFEGHRLHEDVAKRCWRSVGWDVAGRLGAVHQLERAPCGEALEQLHFVDLPRRRGVVSTGT